MKYDNDGDDDGDADSPGTGTVVEGKISGQLGKGLQQTIVPADSLFPTNKEFIKVCDLMNYTFQNGHQGFNVIHDCYSVLFELFELNMFEKHYILKQNFIVCADIFYSFFIC